jgi:hypothetical protein
VIPTQRCLRPLSLATIGLATAALLSLPIAGHAKGCSESLVGQPNQTPSALWGELQPAGVILDATGYNGNQRADSRYPQATEVDIENGYLFASYWAGFGIWDLHGDPANPVRLRLLDGWLGAFPQWSIGQSETDQFIYTLDVPVGDDSLLAVGGISPLGLSIWDVSNKAVPVALYQDAFGKEISQVYAARINGRSYAFAGGSFSGGEFGLFIYDMTEARNRNYVRCVENVSQGIHTCPGVYVTKIGTGNDKTQYVHGMPFGAKHFIVISPGQSSVHFLKIYDVSDPAHPALVVSGFTGSGVTNFTSGVALWQQGSNAYLAVRVGSAQSSLQIFDVTTCLTSGCASLGTPITNISVAPITESSNWKTLSFSRHGTTPMLFLGNHDLCHTGEPYQHTEYLFDVSNPLQPRDITPTATTTYQGETVDYWSYYYSDDVKGFGFSAPRSAKFWDAPDGTSYLYRADLTLFDVHKLVALAAPVPHFISAPTVVWAGDPVTFTDTSTGVVTSRTWTFEDGNVLSGFAGSWWKPAPTAPAPVPPRRRASK